MRRRDKKSIGCIVLRVGHLPSYVRSLSFTWKTTAPNPNSFEASRSIHSVLAASKCTSIDDCDIAFWSSLNDVNSAGVGGGRSFIDEYFFLGLPATLGDSFKSVVFNSYRGFASWA